MAEPLIIGGSGTDLATFRLLAESFRQLNPQADIIIKPSVGSSGGIKAVLKGLFHLSLSSRPPRDSEEVEDVKFHYYARTPLVFAVSDATPVFEITATMAADIYAGVQHAWPDGSPARPILRPVNDSDSKLLVQALAPFRSALPNAYKRKELPIAVTDQDAANMISQLRGALGTSTLALILAEQKALRPLKLDGIDPTAINQRDNQYPMFKSLYMVYRPDHGHETLQAFIHFIDSATGKNILRRTGHFLAGE